MLIKLQPAVKQETRRIAYGTLILTAIMIVVFIVIGRFDLTVLWGALLGAAAATGNFFLLAVSVQQAAEKMNGVQMESFAEKDAREESEEANQEQKQDASADTPEIRQARRGMQTSYTLRMLMLAATAIIGVTVSVFHPVATLVPFLFPQLIIYLWNFTQSHRKEG